MERRTQEVLDRLGAGFKANRRAAHLSVAEQQQIEIARALFYRSRILVMDEPTAALSDRETERLFDVVRQLRADGLAIIYISHRMAEIYDLADRLSVFRDGEFVGELERAACSSERVIEMMVGRRLEDFYKRNEMAVGSVLGVTAVVSVLVSLMPGISWAAVPAVGHQGTGDHPCCDIGQIADERPRLARDDGARRSRRRS